MDVLDDIDMMCDTVNGFRRGSNFPLYALLARQTNIIEQGRGCACQPQRPIDSSIPGKANEDRLSEGPCGIGLPIRLTRWCFGYWLAPYHTTAIEDWYMNFGMIFLRKVYVCMHA